MLSGLFFWVWDLLGVLCCWHLYLLCQYFTLKPRPCWPSSVLNFTNTLSLLERMGAGVVSPQSLFIIRELVLGPSYTFRKTLCTSDSQGSERKGLCRKEVNFINVSLNLCNERQCMTVRKWTATEIWTHKMKGQCKPWDHNWYSLLVFDYKMCNLWNFSPFSLQDSRGAWWRAGTGKDTATWVYSSNSLQWFRELQIFNTATKSCRLRLA